MKGFCRVVMVMAFLLTIGQMAFADVGAAVLYGAEFAPAARIIAYLGPSLPP